METQEVNTHIANKCLKMEQRQYDGTKKASQKMILKQHPHAKKTRSLDIDLIPFTKLKIDPRPKCKVQSYKTPG